LKEFAWLNVILKHNFVLYCKENRIPEQPIINWRVLWLILSRWQKQSG